MRAKITLISIFYYSEKVKFELYLNLIYILDMYRILVNVYRDTYII